MIRSKDLNEEIKILDDVTKDKAVDEKGLLRALVKGITLVLKVIRDIKTNQVLSLKKEGVALVKSVKFGARSEDKTEEKKV